MISEIAVASKFDGLWGDALPLLTPSFVRVFNEVYCQELTDYPKFGFRQTPIGVHVDKHDLVAEMSFQLARLATELDVDVSQLRGDQDKLLLSYGRSTAFLQKYRTENQVILLNDDEILESFALAAQYRALFDFVGAAKVEFNPIIRGAGFLGVCSADLSIDDTLYEVKTVSRKITGRDIRQLMVYLALQYSTGIRRWISAGFFNPRKSLHYKFSIEHLIYRTSGGRAVPDVFGAIIDFLSTRGVEIDTEF